MADGKDPTSYNYELRTMGFRGNDEEDLAADAEELLGSNAAIDHDPEVQGVPHGNPASGTASPSTAIASAIGSGASRKRRSSTSKVWNDFEEIFEVTDGKECRTGTMLIKLSNSRANRASG